MSFLSDFNESPNNVVNNDNNEIYEIKSSII